MKELDLVSIRLNKEKQLFSEMPIGTPEQATKLIVKDFGDLDREALIVINLNTKNMPINASVVTVGTLNASIVSVRELFKTSILSNANSIIVLHNHPSGDLTPSKNDLEFTRRIAKAGQLMEIPLTDHIIFNYKEETNSLRKNIPSLFEIDNSEIQDEVQVAVAKNKTRVSFKDIKSKSVKDFAEDCLIPTKEQEVTNLINNKRAEGWDRFILGFRDMEHQLMAHEFGEISPNYMDAIEFEWQGHTYGAIVYGGESPEEYKRPPLIFNSVEEAKEYGLSYEGCLLPSIEELENFSKETNTEIEQFATDKTIFGCGFRIKEVNDWQDCILMDNVYHLKDVDKNEIKQLRSAINDSIYGDDDEKWGEGGLVVKLDSIDRTEKDGKNYYQFDYSDHEGNEATQYFEIHGESQVNRKVVYAGLTEEAIKEVVKEFESIRENGTLHVLKVEVGKEPEVIKIANSLEALQKAVGGYVESFALEGGGIVLIDEEGKLKNKEPNRAFRSDMLVGDFLVVGEKGDDWASLTNKQIEQYTNLFLEPVTPLQVLEYKSGQEEKIPFKILLANSKMRAMEHNNNLDNKENKNKQNER